MKRTKDAVPVCIGVDLGVKPDETAVLIFGPTTLAEVLPYTIPAQRAEAARKLAAELERKGAQLVKDMLENE